ICSGLPCFGQAGGASTRRTVMKQTGHDVLTQPVEHLKAALGQQSPGRERDWADEARAALADLELALREHTDAAEEADGPYAEADLPRPTIVRQMNELRHQHGDFLAEVRALRQELDGAAQAFQPVPPAGEVLGALPRPASVRAVPDFNALRDRVSRLVDALE